MSCTNVFYYFRYNASMHSLTERSKYSKEQIEACIALLEDLIDGDGLAHLTKEQKVASMMAAGGLSRPDKMEIEKRRRIVLRHKSKKIEEYERLVRASTGIRSARKAPVFTAPKKITLGNSYHAIQTLRLIKPRACYVCKKEFSQV